MRYVYINALGKIENAVSTGGANDPVPDDAYQWPEELNFSDVLTYGIDTNTNEFLRYDPSTKPAEYYEYDFKLRQWVYQQDTANRAERARRNLRLEEMDALLANPLRWAAMTQAEKDAWAGYRQALLDIPQQAGFPQNIVWPTAPL